MEDDSPRIHDSLLIDDSLYWNFDSLYETWQSLWNPDSRYAKFAIGTFGAEHMHYL